jgi:hypothetical protein
MSSLDDVVLSPAFGLFSDLLLTAKFDLAVATLRLEYIPSAS